MKKKKKSKQYRTFLFPLKKQKECHSVQDKPLLYINVCQPSCEFCSGDTEHRAIFPPDFFSYQMPI